MRVGVEAPRGCAGSAVPSTKWAWVAAALLAASGSGNGSADTAATGASPEAPSHYLPLYPSGTKAVEKLQYTEPDGTLVTLMGMRPTERHARERGEGWTEPDVGPGRYLTFPSFYFQNRTFGIEIRDGVPAGR